MRIEYQKPALNINALLDLLRQEGLGISNPETAIIYIKTVGYHRLSQYFSPFQHRNKSTMLQKFKPGTTFDNIWQLYCFDKSLRILMLEALEQIEVAFRNAISNTMSIKFGTHWYLELKHYKTETFFALRPLNHIINEIDAACKKQEKSDESAIRDYYTRYSYPKYPPSWIIFEKFSFGVCTSLFRNLGSRQDKKLICKTFNYHPSAIESWMDSLRYTRNLCAHHARLWNRWFVLSPKLEYLYGKNFKKNNTFYAQALITHKLLLSIDSKSDWRKRLFQLFNNYPGIDYEQMGFIGNWTKDRFWQLDNERNTKCSESVFSL